MPIYVSRDEEEDVTIYLVMTKTKAEEKAVDKQPKKKISVSRYPFKFVEKNYNRKPLERKFQNKIQTAVSGTEHTVTTESGKLVRRKHNLGTIVFHTEKKKRAGTANRKQNHTEELTLPPRGRREIYSVERSTSRHTEWKIEVYLKPDAQIRIGVRK